MSDSSLLHGARTPDVTGVDAVFLQDHPWVRYYEQGTSPHLDIPDRPLTWLLDTTAIPRYSITVRS